MSIEIVKSIKIPNIIANCYNGGKILSAKDGINNKLIWFVTNQKFVVDTRLFVCFVA